MSKQIIIDVQQEQIRVAFLEEGDLVEMHIEDYNQQRVVGNIYRGRVANVLPGMQAAFVDIGLEKMPFSRHINTDKTVLSLPSSSRVRKACAAFLSGSARKARIDSAGRRNQSAPRVPEDHPYHPAGRYMVHADCQLYGVSRRPRTKPKAAVKEITEGIKPETMGIIAHPSPEEGPLRLSSDGNFWSALGKLKSGTQGQEDSQTLAQG